MAQQQFSRNTMMGSLVMVRNLGFQPKTSIDVGAGLGTFPLYEAFPNSHHLLIEPIAENEPYLAQICRHLPSAEYTIAAASRQAGVSQLQVSPELVYSALTNSAEATRQDPYLRSIPTITLDEYCQQRGLKGPYLIKVDVDGHEMDVLEGATQILKDTEYILIEVTLFGQIYEVISFMKSQGFAIYDILEESYRSPDGALWQVDMAFVKESGQFRREKRYAHRQEDIEGVNSFLQTYREQLINYINTKYKAPSESKGSQTVESPTPAEIAIDPAAPRDGYVII